MKNKSLIVLFMAIAPFWCKAQYMVSINPASPLAEETAVVSWSAPSTADIRGDWIGVYPAGFPLSAKLLKSASGTRNGSINVTFDAPGDYVLQYFDGKFGVGLSDPLIVSVQANPEAYILTVSVSRTTINSLVAVSWQSKTNLDTTGDVVGYYSTAKAFVQYAPVEGRHNGVAYFTTLRPGVFTFGYFRGGQIARVKVPTTVTVDSVPVKPAMVKAGGNIILSWQGYSGATYRVIQTTNLVAALSSWTELKRIKGSYTKISLTNAISGPRKFYGVQELW